jgi:hypothetical protein
MPPTKAAVRQPPPGPEALRQRLAALRHRLRMVTAFRGGGLFLALLLAAVAAAGLLDWRVHLPPLVRALLLVATLVAAGLVALRYLIRPLADRTDDLTLALRVEERFPGFNDALASTVQFLDQAGPAAPPDSASLRRAAIQRTLGRAQGLDFTRVVDRRGLRAAVLSAAGALAVAVVLVALDPALAATALVRFAAPFGPRDWPRQTQIEVEAPRERIGRNEAFEVRARLRGVIPDQAGVTFQYDGLPPVVLTSDVAREGTHAGKLLVRLPPDRVQRSFRFRVTANDAVSDEYAVTVLPPPVLVPLGPDEPSPHVQLFFPAYTDLPSPAELPPGTGNVEAVAGTAVRLRARADRPLRQAAVEFIPEEKSTVPALLLAPLGANSGLSAAAAIAGGQTVWAVVPAVLDADRCSFTVNFLPRVAGLYALHFEDESGLAASRLFELRLRPDPAPVVQLDRPSPGRDLLSVLPEAVLTLHAAVDDPVFAVRSVFLEYRVGKQAATGRVSLYDSAALAARVAPAVGPGIRAAGLRPRQKRVEIDQPLPVRLLTHPDGSPPQEGDVILLTACADDFDDVTFDKQPGRSHEVEIRVVGRETLEVAINEEQTRLQQDLLRLREKQREALGKVTGVENELKKGAKLGPEQLDQLLQAEQVQQQVREQVRAEKDGILARAERVLDALRQNRLESSSDRDRVEAVARELNRLSQEELEQAEAQLANARNRAELQEEKDAPERHNRDEARAREAERQAGAADAAAQEKAAEAARAAEAADKAGDSKEKARLTEEAEQSRRQAEGQKKKARELLKEAERARREAAEPARPRQALAEARAHQEEVEKTVTDLLQRMEPWTNSREIKGEAGRILQEQQKAQEAARELSERKDFPQGESRERLTEAQKVDLDARADAQKKVRERMNQLLETIKRVADDRKAKDPEAAQKLEEARDRALQNNLQGRMEDAADQVKNNQLGKARESQKEVTAGLKQLLKDLDERREADLERLAKKMRETEKEIDKLFDEQERLKKKVKEAEAIADPKQREEALKALHREQEQLKKKAQELVQKLSRDRDTARAARAMGKAAEQMEQAAQRLGRGEKPDDETENALDRLDEARAEAEQATDRTENELEREQRARVADLLKRLKERQESLSAESTRVQHKLRRALEAKDEKAVRELTRGSLSDVVTNEKNLGGELEEVAKKELTGAPVFARLVRRSAEAMRQAGERLESMTRRGRPPRPDNLPDEESARLQAQAVRRLDQVLEALKDENGGGRLTAAPGGGGGGGGGADGGGGDDSVPPTAQLKVLRKLQEDINNRTEEFAKGHPDPKNLDDKAKAELEGIRRDQQDVAELLEKLRGGGEPNAAEGDKP